LTNRLPGGNIESREAPVRINFARAFLLGILLVTLAFPAGELQAIPRQEQKPQQPPPKPQPQGEYAISVEVPLVNVDVVVTDNNGTFIPGLKKENFRVLEDGVPQTITNFAPAEAPITIVLLIEFSRLFYSYFAYQSTNWAYEFLNHLNKDDYVALVTFDLQPHLEADFTKNKAEVQNVLARLYYPNFREAGLFGAVVDTLDRLKDVKGKKAILLVASGFDTGLGKYTLDDALKACRQTDVTIFSVGVGRDAIERFRLDNIGYFQAQNQLKSFARITGGRDWFPRFQGELPGIFREVADMLRNQYSLGYVPGSKSRDGKFHKIKVEMVDANGNPLVVVDQHHKRVKYVVYAREGYVASKGGVSD
jgi:VWFA-related protein